jgi:DNA-binding response OmpR family regulator
MSVPKNESNAAILVVDDDQDVRSLAREMLCAEGFDVIDAGDGEAALALLSARPVDVLFTDLMMPGLNGLDLAALAVARKPGLKILYTSGCARHPSLVGSAGPRPEAAFLAKPYLARELVARVRGLLDGG